MLCAGVSVSDSWLQCFQVQFHPTNNCRAAVFHVIIAGIQIEDTQGCSHRSSLLILFGNGNFCSLSLQDYFCNHLNNQSFGFLISSEKGLETFSQKSSIKSVFPLILYYVLEFFELCFFHQNMD